MNQFNDFVLAVAPALKAAFLKGFKVLAYIVLSAAIAAVAAYVSGNTQIDPTVVFAVNAVLAFATKFVATLNT